MVDIGQKSLGVIKGNCRDRTAALMNGPLGGVQQSALGLYPSDQTTSHSTGETTNHSSGLPNKAKLVVGYRQANNASQLAGYAFC